MFPQIQNACSCSENWLTIDHVHRSDLILKGKVISSEGMDGNKRSYNRHKIEIQEVIKGKYRSPEIEIFAHNWSSSCTVNFTINESYFLFVHERNAEYFTGYCSENRLTKNYKGHFREILEGYLNENTNVWCDPFNNISSTGIIKRGRKTGTWNYYFYNGMIKSIKKYFMGLKSGNWKYFKLDYTKPNKERKPILYKEEYYFLGWKINEEKYQH